MSGPTPESLAMDCGLKCDMCKEEVNYGDDYIAHLQFAHSVTQNIPFFMKTCAKTSKKKFGQKKDEFEDWNWTFVQMVMGRGFMKKVHCIELSEPDPPTFKDSSTRCIEASLFYTLEALN